MSDFEIYTKDNAPEAAKPLLEAAQKEYGFVPNLYGVMSESPVMLEAYRTLAGLVTKSSLSAIERQVVFQVNNFEAECVYCLSAHTTLSQMDGVPAEVTEALRAGAEIPDPRLNTLANFTRSIRNNFGVVSDADKQAFFDAGFTKAQLLDVIVLTAMKTLSNYTNKVGETPVDAAFEPTRWSKPAVAAE